MSLANPACAADVLDETSVSGAGDTTRCERGGLLNVLGTTLRLLAGGADTGDTFALLEVTVPPGATVPMHSHPQAEAFYVLDGELEFGRQSGEAVSVSRVAAGQCVHVPREARHSFRNAGPGDVRVLVACEAGLVAFFEDAGREPATDGPPTREQIDRVVAIMQRHGQRLFGPHPGAA